jgi:hypothetical protein
MSNKQPMTLRSIMSEYANIQHKQANLADAMMKAAVRCGSLKAFLAECEIQERWVTSEEATRMRLNKVPSHWTQTKSDIKRAWEQGLHPKNFESYSQLKKAKGNLGKKEQASSEPKQTRSAAEPKGEVPTLSLVAKSTEPEHVLPADMREIVELITPLSEVARKRCINEMQAIASKYRAKHDEQRRESAKPKTSIGSGRVVDVA